MQAARFVSLLGASGDVHDDPETLPSIGSRDPSGDDLVALAMTTRSYLVTGDDGLLVLAGDLPVLTPRGFMTLLAG